MAVNATSRLPRAMLIDMDDTILSAYGRPEIAWNKIAAEFARELAPLSPQKVAAEVLAFARQFWSTADASWRLKLTEARREVVKGGFAALGSTVAALSDELAVRLADRFTAAIRRSPRATRAVDWLFAGLMGTFAVRLLFWRAD